MKKYNVTFMKAAYDDLDKVFDFILLDNPKAAKHMLDTIMKQLGRLEEFPLLGKPLYNKHLNYYRFRMVIINPYIVFYRFIDDTVYIYRILHDATNYIDILKG